MQIVPVRWFANSYWLQVSEARQKNKKYIYMIGELSNKHSLSNKRVKLDDRSCLYIHSAIDYSTQNRITNFLSNYQILLSYLFYMIMESMKN